MLSAGPLPESRHFQLEPLVDGVYAALAKEGGVAVSNAGIVDLGDRVLVFDTFLAPQAARDLRAAAEQVTGRPVSMVVNSHWHASHVLGNQAFDPAALRISTRQTRELMAQHIPAWIQTHRQDDPRSLLEFENQYQTEHRTKERHELLETITFYQMLMDDLPYMVLTPPTLTFERQITLYGASRRVELLTFGSGHTASDAILYLPVEQIAFVGDLLVTGRRHPWLGDGDPDEWLRIYAQLEALDPPIEVLVPGHGPVGTPADFAALRRYIPALRQAAASVVQVGGSVEDAMMRPVPAAFSDWQDPATFSRNMRFLYERLAAPAP